MSVSGESDELATIHAAIAGDEQAFDRLVGHYAARLRWLIQMRLPTAIQARTSADDVLQEAMLVVHQRIGSLQIEAEAAFWTWLCRVVEQRIVDVQRTHMKAAARDVRRERKPAAASPQATSVRLDQILPGTATSPSGRLRNVEQRQALRSVLEQLPESYRDVIVLRILEGQSVAETAEMMNRSPGAVSVLLSKAVKRLSGVIGSQGLQSGLRPDAG